MVRMDDFACMVVTHGITSYFHAMIGVAIGRSEVTVHNQSVNTPTWPGGPEHGLSSCCIPSKEVTVIRNGEMVQLAVI